jgi:hypothetical protein
MRGCMAACLTFKALTLVDILCRLKKFYAVGQLHCSLIVLMFNRILNRLVLLKDCE